MKLLSVVGVTIFQVAYLCELIFNLHLLSKFHKIVHNHSTSKFSVRMSILFLYLTNMVMISVALTSFFMEWETLQPFYKVGFGIIILLCFGVHSICLYIEYLTLERLLSLESKASFRRQQLQSLVMVVVFGMFSILNIGTIFWNPKSNHQFVGRLFLNQGSLWILGSIPPVARFIIKKKYTLLLQKVQNNPQTSNTDISMQVTKTPSSSSQPTISESTEERNVVLMIRNLLLIFKVQNTLIMKLLNGVGVTIFLVAYLCELIFNLQRLSKFHKIIHNHSSSKCSVRMSILFLHVTNLVMISVGVTSIFMEWETLQPFYKVGFGIIILLCFGVHSICLYIEYLTLERLLSVESKASFRRQQLQSLVMVVVLGLFSFLSIEAIFWTPKSNHQFVGRLFLNQGSLWILGSIPPVARFIIKKKYKLLPQVENNTPQTSNTDISMQLSKTPSTSSQPTLSESTDNNDHSV
ncbi:hypothetical protein DFA_03281 [Cavenderia fasciculata]|uniref:Uncharacterized protein n=1 Tax=Cavenderia fasciculata TaxID=261658 RepID=F4PH51_CACFS|nr:uncharacterized protein DFA_03281 [Cavenderia fasciculata]EGG25035.1 hypothetical protein DFA_03281 [Cavenderia fasciculata]|eukprot:XP_004362886.1 hypothetical protein DFA_03281 [Cavenderia fasciculata]